MAANHNLRLSADKIFAASPSFFIIAGTRQKERLGHDFLSSEQPIIKQNVGILASEYK